MLFQNGSDIGWLHVVSQVEIRWLERRCDTVGQNMEESMFNRFAKRLVDHFMLTPSTVDKRFGIERSKALGAMIFEGIINLADMKKW